MNTLNQTTLEQAKRTSAKFADYINRKQNEYGAQFDPSDLALQFVPYFRDRTQRLKVDQGCETVTGFVGVTTGWKPSFLLLRTKRSICSSYLLSHSDKIISISNR